MRRPIRSPISRSPTVSRVTTTIDQDALRARYRAERDKRLRPDGNEQYLEPTGRFAHLLDDPYAERVEREPLFDEVTVAFIGGGFAGLVTGARLKQAGIDDVRIIEGGGDVGGAWYWNRYPGAMCDTAAMIYLPLLEETGHMPTQKYIFAPEIFGHAQRIATHFGLYDNALFSTAGHRASSGTTTRVALDHPHRPRRRASGPGSSPWAPARCTGPKLPGIPGIETFAGHTFHTSRWDYDYTGGDPGGAPMAEPRRQAGRHHRHRRHGGAVHPAAGPRRAASCSCSSARRRRSTCATTTPIDPEWFATLEPGWQQEWLINFATLQTGGFADEDLVQGRLDRHRQAHPRPGRRRDGRGRRRVHARRRSLQAFEDSDDEKMTEIRARVDAIVARPGHGRGAQAVVPAAVQAAVLPRRVPAGLQRARTCTSSTPTARASSASTRPACGSAACTTSSTA